MPTAVDAATVPAAGRRERGVDPSAEVVTEALGAKLLHGWLQNRHQTLMPLTLNVALLTRPQREAWARIVASLLLAGRPGAEAADFAPKLRAGLGDDVDALSAFDDALKTPLPLNVVFETAQASNLTIYAYVAALMASDARYPVSVMLCDMIQARFELPAALVRSAARRYRR